MSEPEVPVPALEHTVETEVFGYTLRGKKTVQAVAHAPEVEVKAKAANSKSKPSKRSDAHYAHALHDDQSDDDCTRQEDPLTYVKHIKELLESVSNSLECPPNGGVLSDSKQEPEIRDPGGGGGNLGTILSYTQKCFKLLSRLTGYLQGGIL